MASSSSSSTTHQTIQAHDHHNNLFLNPNPYPNPTVAPPPTPSTTTTTSTAAAADTLTRLLHRLPPTLSFPTRHRLSPLATTSTTTKTTHLPSISLANNNNLDMSAAFQLGYFQLSPLDHRVTPQLAESAESESVLLFDLPVEEKHGFFPREWPFGYDDDDEENNDDDMEKNSDNTASFCFDGRLPLTATTESSVNLKSLSELTRELEKVGLDVIEKLACTLGFENPFGENGSDRSSSMMWVSSSEDEKMGKEYPYVVGLQYQIRARKWSLESGLGSVIVEPEVGSILVTIGDIAQVWSNGKLNKVRGRPNAILEDGAKSRSRCITMTMLLTPRLESMVSPLVVPSTTKIIDVEASKPEKNSNEDEDEDGRVFNSFSFEDYAWRVYNERLHLKDPLDRYRRLLN